MGGEMEEARALLDSAERGKRQTESELTEARMAVNEMNNVNSRAAADKRRLEGAVHTLQAEIDDMLHQAKGSEEKARRQWLTLLVLLMSSAPSRIMSLSNPRTRGPWRPPWLTWRTVLLTPMTLP